MARATNAPAAKKRHKKILKYAKGYFGNKSKLFRYAKEAVQHAWQYAYIARKGGDTSYDNLGPSLARRSQAPSSRRIMRFAQERGRAGTAEAVSSFRRTFLS